MKRQIFWYFGFLSIALVMLVSTVNAQNGDPPPPPSQHGETGNQPAGGGAPIGEGLTILTLLGTAWAGRKWYQKHKQTLAE
jgi:hypothetical protein